jgi:hypothetical protein
MRTKQILLMMLAVGLSRCLACADGLTNNSTRLRIVRHGNYTYTFMVTSNGVVYVNPSEFWPGTWREDANGWRVQLCIYPQTNTRFREGVAYPLSTNLMLSVDWGSAVKNSGEGYYMTPNGKYARFELLDAHGNVVPPNPSAGTNLLLRNLKGRGFSSFGDSPPTYETHLPAWASPTSGSLVASFPKTISTNLYPHFKYGGIVGNIGSATNFPPFCVGLLKLDEIYSVTKEGDYALTVQPVLYKRRNQADTGVLDRVDLPSVTTKVHLVPSER